MNTTVKGMEYYETEGMRLMDAGMDAQARSCFVKAAELGSGRAKVFLQYLDMNVSDEDFRDFLRANGIDVAWDESDHGHDWDFWEQEIRHVILDWME